LEERTADARLTGTAFSEAEDPDISLPGLTIREPK
jgi:hypothetical protein